MILVQTTENAYSDDLDHPFRAKWATVPSEVGHLLDRDTQKASDKSFITNIPAALSLLIMTILQIVMITILQNRRKFLVAFVMSVFASGLLATGSMSQSSRIAWSGLWGTVIPEGENNWIELVAVDGGDKFQSTIEIWFDLSDGTLHVYNLGRDIVGHLQDGYAHVTPLDGGEVIGPSSDWQHTELSDGDGGNDDLLPLISSSSYTAWHGKTAYVGLQISPDNRTHYGWIKITVSDDGSKGTFQEMAFNTYPERPIIAGDRGPLGSRRAITQTSPTLCFSITTSGNVGYLRVRSSPVSPCPPTVDEDNGNGMNYRGRSLLAGGGLLLGVDETRVLSTINGQDRWSDEGQDKDLVQAPGSTARMVRSGTVRHGRVLLDDRHAETPIGLSISQESFSFDTLENGDFLILRYTVTNLSPDNIENMFIGLYIDWDLGENILRNLMDFDEITQMGYAQDAAPSSGYPVAGIRLLTEGLSVNHYAGEEPRELDRDGFGLNPNSLISRKGKWEVLSGAKQRRYIHGVDVFQIVSAGPIRIASGDKQTIAFALVAGDEPQDLSINADQALKIYRDGDLLLLSGEETTLIPEWVTIGEAFPNPMINETTFEYRLAQSTHVEVDIYDLLGRHVFRLLANRKKAGRHVVNWNTDNLVVPGGVYAVRWNMWNASGQYRDSRFVIVK